MTQNTDIDTFLNVSMSKISLMEIILGCQWMHLLMASQKMMNLKASLNKKMDYTNKNKISFFLL